MNGHGDAQDIPQASHEEFIIEHYWGHTARGGERTSEYRVAHPRWKIWPADSFEFKADVATLYGEKLVETLASPSKSAFMADGSFVSVVSRSE